MDIKKNIIIAFATTLLGGCGSIGNIKGVEPSKYAYVTDYLNDIFENQIVLVQFSPRRDGYQLMPMD
ncbi:hypothetical protein OM297_22785 [Escherichia albertii]|nr:hypothetical protein [Escherichia albertii]